MFNKRQKIYCRIGYAGNLVNSEVHGSSEKYGQNTTSDELRFRRGGTAYSVYEKLSVL